MIKGSVSASQISRLQGEQVPRDSSCHLVVIRMYLSHRLNYYSMETF